MMSLVFLGILNVSTARGDLSFYRALEHVPGNTKKDGAYDRILLPPGAYTGAVYVARTPILKIELHEIESVLVSQVVEFEGDLREALRESRRKTPRQVCEENRPDRKCVFNATFLFNAAAGRRFASFGQKHKNQTFLVKFNGYPLNVVRVENAVDSRGTWIDLRFLGKDRRHIEDVFFPISGKVSWKAD